MVSWNTTRSKKALPTFDTSFDIRIRVKIMPLIFFFEIPWAISELPAKWPIKFSEKASWARPVSWKLWKGSWDFKTKINGITFHHNFYVKTGDKCPLDFLWYSWTLLTYRYLDIYNLRMILYQKTDEMRLKFCCKPTNFNVRVIHKLRLQREVGR